LPLRSFLQAQENPETARVGNVDQREIYVSASHARRYDALVRAEDCDGHLVQALDAIAPIAGASWLEVGAGTGRITRQLVERGAARVIASDRAAAMLSVAGEHVGGARRVSLAVADARALPVASGWADAAVAGWVFGHFRYWMPDGWRDHVGAALDEMARALRPGGALVVVETLGTGTEVAAPPSAALAEYYAWLERERGLRRVEIATDYEFRSAADAADVMGFFFGDQMADRVRDHGWRRVPEHTGVWSR